MRDFILFLLILLAFEINRKSNLTPTGLNCILVIAYKVSHWTRKFKFWFFFFHFSMKLSYGEIFKDNFSTLVRNSTFNKLIIFCLVMFEFLTMVSKIGLKLFERNYNFLIVNPSSSITSIFHIKIFVNQKNFVPQLTRGKSKSKCWFWPFRFSCRFSIS